MSISDIPDDVLNAEIWARVDVPGLIVWKYVTEHKPLRVLNLQEVITVVKHGIDYIEFWYKHMSENHIITAAVMNGDIDIIKWCLIRIPWNSTYAIHADIPVLEWLDDNNYEWKSGCLLETAAMDGRLDLIEWLYNRDCQWDNITCPGFANLEILQYVRNMDDNACTEAAEYGKFENLKWLRSCGYQWDEETIAATTDLEIIKWMRDRTIHGNDICPWNVKTFNMAIKRGDIEIITWLRDNNCPANKSTCFEAVKRNSLEILKLLRCRFYMCPIGIDSYKYAYQCGYNEILEWMLNEPI